MQQLGIVISQNRPVSLEFSFGKLVAKEREVDFIFAAGLYLAHGLEVPVDAASDIETSATFAEPDRNAMQSLCLKGSSLQEASNADGWCYRPQGSADVLTLCKEDVGLASSGADETARSSSSRAGSSRANSSRRFVPSHQMEAFEAALSAHITDLEELASKKIREKATLENMYEQSLAAQKRSEASRATKLRDHATYLQQQIKEKEQLQGRQPLANQDFDIRYTGMCATPGSASTSSQCQSYTTNALRDALDEQVNAKRLRKEKLRALERRFEMQVLDAERDRQQAQQHFERESKASDRESLNAAWREQTRIQEILRAVENDTPAKPRLASGLIARSSRGTPRSARSARGHSSHGSEAIGAAASLTLQLQPPASARSSVRTPQSCHDSEISQLGLLMWPPRSPRTVGSSHCSESFAEEGLDRQSLLAGT